MGFSVTECIPTAVLAVRHEPSQEPLPQIWPVLLRHQGESK